MNKQSSLYQELNHAELLRIMASVFPQEKVTDYHLLSGGLFNTTYRVITDQRDVVLRMGPVHRELLLPYERDLMAAEALTNQLCRENGIPASVVLHLDTSKAVIDRDFMIVDYIDSIPLSDPSIPEECRKDILFECGKLARRLHAITGNQFGRLSNIVTGKGCSSWCEAVFAEFDDILSQAQEYQVFDSSLCHRVYAFLDERNVLLDTVNVPHLAHADLWAGNILVRKTAENYQVCAIIDGDRALFGDENFDLATPWMITPEFLAGYGFVTDSADLDNAEKRKVYTLLLALHDAYVWKVEYGRPDIAEENIRTAENILNS